MGSKNKWTCGVWSCKHVCEQTPRASRPHQTQRERHQSVATAIAGNPLTSLNCRFFPNYLQDWAQNDATVLPLVWGSKILPSSARPAARKNAGCRCGMQMRDAGCRCGTQMHPTLGLLWGVLPPLHSQSDCSRWTASSGQERRLGTANPRGDRRLHALGWVLQSRVAKTFIELSCKCTVGCVYRAAYKMLLWKNTQYLNTLFFFFFLSFQNGACAVILHKT